MLSMEHILNKQGITQSLRKQIASMLSATAPNRGICCRCGKGAEWQCRPEGLQKGCSGKRHSATAPNCGIRCRCGKRAEWQCRPEGLQKGCSGEKHSATAPNRGIRCRCGKRAEWQCRPEGLQKGCSGKRKLRNGTESREMLPLWQRGRQPTRQATKQANQADKKRRNKPKQAK